MVSNYNCYHHPTKNADAVCIRCQQFICSDCKTVVDTNSYCKSCITQIQETSESRFDIPGLDLRRAECPACHGQLKKIPAAKTKCPHCGKYMRIKTRPSDRAKVIVTEEDAEKIDDEWKKRAMSQGNQDVFSAEKREGQLGKAQIPFVIDKHALDWLSTHMGWAVAEFGQTTADKLSEILTHGFKSGQSIRQIAYRIAGITDAGGAKIFSEERANTIAETEVMSAYRMGDLASLREGGYFKEVYLDAWEGACDACKKFGKDTYTLDEAEEIEGPHNGTWCNCACQWRAVDPEKKR